ncbi:serine/threonine-protein phosphatase 6 regulatory ankyrin repeat subunit A-like [Scylla paramamosain]|uniref:serine/threonine-protein phosphatase 6 regulatory ankyrin repeat subunit A-like n=1 Tax=Scylla paramamosain TaxID=85552 RepID=UPI0030826DFB
MAGVRSALNRGARPEVTVLSNAGVSLSLLTWAAIKGHDHLLTHLLQAGLSIEGGGTTDSTPLMMAAYCGHTHTVKALLDLRANPLAMDSRGEAVLVVVVVVVVEVVAYTPVHAACYRGHVEVLEQLAGAGWPLTARDIRGNTPMHYAAAGGSVTCLQWLVQRGGDTSTQNNAGLTPLDQVGSGEGQEGGRMQSLLRCGSKFNR